MVLRGLVNRNTICQPQSGINSSCLKNLFCTNHRSHLTSSAVMLCEVPEDTELERNADVALEDKALIGAWSDLRA